MNLKAVLSYGHIMATPLRNEPERLIQPARKHVRQKHRLDGRRQHDVGFARALPSQQPEQQDVAVLIGCRLQHGEIPTLSIGGAAHQETTFRDIERPVWKAG